MFRTLLPLLIALQFLTILPIRFDKKPDASATGQSLFYYPLAGLLIGILLLAVASILRMAPPLITAAVLLTTWVIITGGLHLDGLADSIDAWMGGHRERNKMLIIMKDPCSGPMAIVALILVLLIKFTALVQLLTIGAAWLIVLTPVLGRTALVLLFLTTPYIRTGGLGSMLASQLPRRACIGAIILTVLAIPALCGWQTILLLVIAAVFFIMCRQFMLRRIGGTTGDTAGALVELTEVITLLTMALIY